MIRSCFVASFVACAFTVSVASCVDVSSDVDDTAAGPADEPAPDFATLCTHVSEPDPYLSFAQWGVGWVSNSCVNVDIPGWHSTSGVNSITTARFTQFEKLYPTQSALNTAIAQCKASQVWMRAMFGNGTTFGAPFLAWGGDAEAVAHVTVDATHHVYSLDTCTAVSNALCHGFYRDGGAITRIQLLGSAGDGSSSGTKIFSSIRVNDPTNWECSGS